MRQLLVLLVCMVVVNSGVADTYRTFKSADGKALKGKLIDYDSRSKTVVLEKENRRSGKISLDQFSDGDQAYIVEWEKSKAFLSNSEFAIECDQRTEEKPKKKDWADLNYEDGNSYGRELIKTTEFEDVYYDLTLKSKSALKGLRLDYQIYYQQSIAHVDDEEEVEQKLKKGHQDVGDLDENKRKIIKLGPASIFNEEMDGSFSWADGKVRKGGQGEVHGMRCRIFMKTDSGDELMREITYPDSLSDTDFPWQE